MATANVLLKTGKMVHLPEDEMITFLEQNRDLIQMRKFKARRQRTVDTAEAATSKG
jgi:hypothetical protein